MSVKSAVASAMIVAPLLLALAVRFWPNRDASQTAISNVVVMPAEVTAAGNFDYLADAVAAALTAHLEKIEGLETRKPPSSLELAGGDYDRFVTESGVDAVVLTAITVDSGIYQLNVQLVDPRTRRLLWSNPYQGPRPKYVEMMRAAGEGLRQVLRPGSPPVRDVGAVSEISEAELAFREGQYYRDRGEKAAASAAFSRAVGLDPSLAAEVKTQMDRSN